MQAKEQHIENWKAYIDVAFIGDDEIVSLYDKAAQVATIECVCESIFEKLSSIKDDVCFYGVEIEGKKVGYFSFKKSLLVSFGMNVLYRERENLITFFETIKQTIGEDFLCYLFSYNQRAIKWLEKAGMTILFNNVTLLQCQF